MDPVTIVAAAVAIGASDGVRETAKTAITDAYASLRNWLTSKYSGVSAEVAGLEEEPDEELRRALLAKKLAMAGANDDSELYELARGLLILVEQQEPTAPATVGVTLRRTSVGRDIEIADIAVEGGSGVVAEDVTADGSLRVSGVSARGSKEPASGDAAPYPVGAETVTSELAFAQTFTSTQRNVNVGRDNVTNVTIEAATAAGNSGGRIRAVTVSVERVPVKMNLWKVTVHNGTSGPITDLEADVYLVDDTGVQSPGMCVPAKDNISVRELAREILTENLSGGLDAIGQRAQGMYAGMPQGMGLGAPQLAQLGSYGPMMTNYLVNSPQLSTALRHVQQQMIDRFPRVVPAGQFASVLYVADLGEVRADIQFADEVGDLWRRSFEQPPQPVLVDDTRV